MKTPKAKEKKVKSGKNPTTNCAPDKHDRFCKRCFAFNNGCPANGKCTL